MDVRLDDGEFPARNPLAEDCHWDGRILPNRDWFMLSARRVWPAATPKALKFAFEEIEKVEYSDRTCRSWASGDYEPPCHKLVLLLRGEEGGRLLDLAMAGASPAWWRQRQEDRRVADLANLFAKGLSNGAATLRDGGGGSQPLP